jgi:hypothetical protein
LSSPIVNPLPEGLRLARGSHESPEDGMCLMEAVSYVAGEPFSDHPECASPVIAAFGRYFNDGLEEVTRQRLLPYVPRLVGSRGTPEVEKRRAWMAVDWLCRVYAPAWLDLAGLSEYAESLRALAPITDAESAKTSQAALHASGQAAKDAWGSTSTWGLVALDAAAAAAGDAAGDAARAARAAWTAWGAEAAAADYAAWNAAVDAAAAAAGDAARAPSYGKARRAADAVLRPTVERLRESAFDLLDAMLEVAA